jgi:chemotaxis-related protein WspB
MLALFFEIGDDVYAIPARFVVEVVPKVGLREVARAPSWLAGMFAYRGGVLPVVDLCRRVFDRSCRDRLSSRIVVVERSGDGDSAARRYGMLVESVTEVRPLPEGAAASLALPEAPYVKATVLDGGQLIQLLDVDRVLPRDLLLPSGTASGAER